MKAKFVLYRDRVRKQYEMLRSLGVGVSYSYKTNREVGDVLQKEFEDCWFSIHAFEEIEMIKRKDRVMFFPQAQAKDEFNLILDKGVRCFVVDNEIDLRNLMDVVRSKEVKVNLIFRMKFMEHRVGSGRYFVYGMPSKLVNELILEFKEDENVDEIGVHVHRKSQNTTEWEISKELEDSLSEESLERISLVNFGGGLPIKYKTYSAEIMHYIFDRIKITKDFLESKGIKAFIEPGRFISGPSVELEAEIMQVYGNTIVLNCSIYNCALDTAITNIRMLVKDELPDNSKEGKFYLLKGNTPTRDDIFRYKVRLKDPKVGDKIVFLNAGAYNYTTDFCCLEKLETERV
tara:strand:+ start:118 stop:1155 length:1038 start_codon:yes stop_codon:yes gene_type:complete